MEISTCIRIRIVQPAKGGGGSTPFFTLSVLRAGLFCSVLGWAGLVLDSTGYAMSERRFVAGACCLGWMGWMGWMGWRGWMERRGGGEGKGREERRKGGRNNGGEERRGDGAALYVCMYMYVYICMCVT